MLLPTSVHLSLQGTGAAAHNSRAEEAVGAAACDSMAIAQPKMSRGLLGDQVRPCSLICTPHPCSTLHPWCRSSVPNNSYLLACFLGQAAQYAPKYASFGVVAK